MKAHRIEFMAMEQQNASLQEKKLAEHDFRRLSNNKLGEILKAADPSSFNCMKLAHYLPVYEELFSSLPTKKIKLLEIGVQHGGSYRLWSNYFGEDLLEWTGIDINPKCLLMNNYLKPEKGIVYCGSQDDPNFIAKIIEERGPFDVIIDDGSHASEHIAKSFRLLAAAVVADGYYIVEDVHACYWTGFRSSSDKENAVRYFQGLVHSLNRQALTSPRRSAGIQVDEEVNSPAPLRKIQFLPSMIICQMGNPDPMIEWKAGLGSVLIPQ